MKVVIIEDEPLASERLQLLLHQYDSSTHLAASLESVEESVNWFARNPAPDMVFADIQLSDGSSFDFFRQLKISPPVIFTTAYDTYALDAFKLLSIDYLLKPVTLEALAAAMNKWEMLQLPRQVPAINYDDIIKLMYQKARHYKSRFMGKSGNKLIFIDPNSIAMFCAENKIVSIITSDNRRYIVEYTLENLEELLDPSIYFRINRSTIINITAISQVKPYENKRLQVILKNSYKLVELIVSRERVMEFRNWANN